MDSCQQLMVGELVIKRRIDQQLTMSSGRDHAAPIENDDTIRIGNSGEPMCHHQHGSIAADPAKGVLEPGFGPRIDTGCRFVEQKEFSAG